MKIYLPHLCNLGLWVRALLCLGLISNATKSHAALGGNYSINPSGTATASNYRNLTSARQDLAGIARNDGGPANGAGVNAPVVFELSPTYVSTGETFPLVFNLVSGANAVNTITIRPASATVSAVTISSSAAVTVDLNGANWFIIDGRPGGVGINRFLTINNTSTSGITLRYMNDASTNVVKHCIIRGVNTSNLGGVVYFGTTTGITGNDNNTIDSCDVRDGSSLPTNCILADGTSGKTNSGNSIINCNIYNFFNPSLASNGIRINLDNDNFILSGNSLYQTAMRTATTGNVHTGIYITSYSNSQAYTITGNYIGGSAPYAGGSAWTIQGNLNNRFIGIDLGLGSVNSSLIQNNTIANFAWVTSGPVSGSISVYCAINISSGKFNALGNTIGNASTGSITVQSSLSGTSVRLLNVESSDTITIANNTIGSITTTGSTTNISNSITAMNINCSSMAFVTGNTIGSATVSNSINASNPSINIFGQPVTGINISGNGKTTIANNLIANLQSNYAGIESGFVSGIIAYNGRHTITGNTIHNLSSSSRLVSSAPGENPVVIGIYSQTSSGMDQVVLQNTIQNLTATATGVSVLVTGIHIFGNSNSVVSRNLVHSLNVASGNTLASMIGVMMNGGANATYTNNMIRLGIDTAGNSIATGCAIYGMLHMSGIVYHNSVYVGGQGVNSSSNTAAFYRTGTTGGGVIMNNIFTNARANNSGTGVNYAFWITSPNDYITPLLKVETNLYHAPTNGGMLFRANSTNFNSISLWQRLTGFDLISGVGNPGFINATGSSSTFNLRLSGTTPAEGSATLISSIANDFDGNLRSAFTPADIGAHAGNFTFADAFTPRIMYTVLPLNTDLLSSRVFNNVNIIDVGTGVPTTGALRPRIWYRRLLPSATAWASTPGLLASGNSNNGLWSFTVDYSLLSITPATGETYQYYFVAQDQASSPLLAYHPINADLHTSVNNQLLAPANPHIYVITPGLPIAIDVGAGKMYTSLTGASGLFAAINNNALSGNTIVRVTSNITEDGTTSLNATGLNTFTLTIQPDSAITRVISNTGTGLVTSMLRLNGARGVTIDGRVGGAGKFIRIVNTHNVAASCNAAIEIAGGTWNTTIRNCVIETNTSNDSTGNIMLGSGANNTISINTNDLRNAQGIPGTAGIPQTLIYSNGNTSVLTITNNNLFNFNTKGIFLFKTGDSCTISGNHFYYNASTLASMNQLALQVASGNNHLISSNFIGGQSPFCAGTAWVNNGLSNGAFTGIHLSNEFGRNVTIQNNVIQNIDLTNTTSFGTFTGIFIDNQLNSGLNEGISITDNTIGHLTTANSIRSARNSVMTGIYIVARVNSIINNNVIGNLRNTNSGFNSRIIGISTEESTVSEFIISNNTVCSLTTPNASTASVYYSLVGIRCGGSVGNVVNNRMYNLSHTATGVVTPSVYGMITEFKNGTISRNLIYNISSSAAGRPIVGGIMVKTFTGLNTIVNNQISITNGANINAAIVLGISDQSSSGVNNNYYYNTISIGGSSSQSSSVGLPESYAFERGGTNLQYVIHLRNNILYNSRVGGQAYAINESFGSWHPNLSSSSNYNLFIVRNLSAAVKYGTQQITLQQWNTNTAEDGNSNVYTTTSLPASSFFTAASSNPADLSIQVAGLQYVKDLGSPLLGINVDFNGNMRPSGITSLGAFEYSTVIPVTWQFISATKGLNSVNIDWATASEINNSHFIVERSLNGTDFTPIAKINGNGTTALQHKYSYHDEQPPFQLAVWYYRIRQVDVNGEFDFSSVVSVKHIDMSLILKPNPFNNNLEVSSETAIDNIEIVDVIGQVKITMSVHANDVLIDTKAMEPGIYFIRVIVGKEVIVKRIIKED